MNKYAEFARIEVTDSCDKANRLLEDWWILLDVFHDREGNLFFVLGCQRTLDIETLYGFASGNKAVSDE